MTVPRSRKNASPTGWQPAWRPLQAGDVVDVVAPASSAPRDVLEAGLQRLRQWGLVPRMPEALLNSRDWHANTDAKRWRYLRRALTSRDSAAVWCVRGGVGCLRLLPAVARLRRPPAKPVIGFSDVTALLVGMDTLWSNCGIHGPVLTQLAPGRLPVADVKRLRDLLFGLGDELSFATLRPMNEAARSATRLDGRLTGGNLATLHSLGGTPFQLRSQRRIVFLEDVNERGYAVDRMLTGLRLSGALRGARAVVFGDFIDGAERDGRQLAPRAIQVFADEVRTPVYTGLPVGHGRRLPPLVMGLASHIERRSRGAVLRQVLRSPG